MTWHVDRTAGDDVAAAADATGTTAFQSIQAAVERAGSGDTVLVGPGIYDNGTAVDTKKTVNRVWISGKTLTLKSTHGASKTHIVGSWDKDKIAATNGCGAAQIRCVCVNSDCAGTVIEGFTLRDGATRIERTATGVLNDDIPNVGGGLAVYSQKKDVYIVDSVISNCTACWGGAIRGGTAVRCLISGNTAFNNPGGARQANLYSCLVTDNAISSASQCPIAVNCTFFGNEGTAGIADVYNCLFGLGESVSASVHDSVRERDDGFQMFAPLMKDYRLLSESMAVTSGVPVDVSNLLGLPDKFVGKDLNGVPFEVVDGKMPVGAIASSATPVCGGILFQDKIVYNGEVRPSSYAFFDSWPQQICVRPCLNEGETFFRFGVTGASTGYSASSRWLQKDGSVWLVPPFAVGTVMTNKSVLANRILWADANYAGGDSDGSEGRPFQTLQDAVNAVNDSAPTVIYAKEGNYNRGEMFCNGRSNRVVIADGRSILLKAVGDADKTVIRGRAASLEHQQMPEFYPGCGSDAVSCISVGASCLATAVQGFTLADGHSNCADYTKDVRSDRCGGIEGRDTAFVQVLDCVFTNCVAVRGGAFYNVWASRCRILDCRAFGGVTRYGVLSSSYVDRSNVAGDGAGPNNASANFVVGSRTMGVHMTIDWPNAASYRCNGSPYQIACVGQNWSFDAIPYYGTVANRKWVSEKAVGQTYGVPQFVDADGGDFRQLSTSCAIAGGNFSDDGTESYVDAMDAYSTFATTGIDGSPIKYTDGVPMAGAYQRPVSALVVAESSGSLAVNGSTESVTNVMPKSITVSVENGKRPVIGFIAGGQHYGYDGSKSSWTIDATDYPSGETFTVAPVYGTNWYVNAAALDNSGDGFAAATAKRTFHGDGGVMENVVDGDCVHVAKGVYDEGYKISKGFLRRRLVVPSGVIVVADEGPENTFIVGAAATESGAVGYDVDAWGRGTNAVACVFLEAGDAGYAVVRGFTLTGGRTHFFYGYDAAKGYWDYNAIGGAAVALQSYDGAYGARVENCIVSNNFSCCGGAFNSVYAINCRVFDNFAENGAASMNSFHQGCIVDSNHGAAAIANPRAVWNCTVGPGNVSLAGIPTFGIRGSYGKDGGVINTICLGMVGNITNANNSIFIKHGSSSFDITDPRIVNCNVLDAEEMLVDENYAPVIGHNPAVDAGDPSLAANEWYGDFDVYGRPRKMNGTRMDIGAVETDWRIRYSRDISRSARLTVVEASPSVEESAVGTVTIPDGGALSIKWRGSGRVASYVFGVRLYGAGELSVDVNGEPFETVSVSGERVMRFMGGKADSFVNLAYSGSGYAEVLSSKRECGSLMILR